MATTTYETHELDSTTGLHCPNCCAWSLLVVRCGLVNSITLELVGVFDSAWCSQCDFTEVTR